MFTYLPVCGVWRLCERGLYVLCCGNGVHVGGFMCFHVGRPRSWAPLLPPGWWQVESRTAHAPTASTVVVLLSAFPYTLEPFSWLQAFVRVHRDCRLTPAHTIAGERPLCQPWRWNGAMTASHSSTTIARPLESCGCNRHNAASTL